MDDEISMENMKKAYGIVDDTIKDLNNKSFQLISIIGVMFTVESLRKYFDLRNSINSRIKHEKTY